MFALAWLFTSATTPAWAEAFSVDRAKPSLLFVATPTVNAEGAPVFSTCAAVVMDAKSGTAITPLQCVSKQGDSHCAPAVSVESERVVAFAELQKWGKAHGRCEVVARDEKSGLAVVRFHGRRDVLKAAAVTPRRTSPGEPLWSVGFSLQIPAFLSRGVVSKPWLHGLPLNNTAPGFASPLLVISGANTLGSAGSGVFDADGALVGLVLADLSALDGAAAIPGAVIQRVFEAHGK